MRALVTFFTPGRTITKGQAVDASDPIVEGREHLFTADDSGPVIEQATAAPGEKRSTPRRPAKRAASK
jgi:hypothetical protein